MLAGQEMNQTKAAIEAVLFVSDRPVSIITLADLLNTEPGEVECALVDIRSQLEEENRGVQLREVAGGWRFYTHPAFRELLEQYVVSWDTRKLSQAALETLSIIAYGQAITRSGVAAIRGVNSDSSINSLIEKGFVREVGTENSPGNPVLYGTTKAFLESFGLRSLQDLPDLESYAPDEETREFIRERLSVSTGGLDFGFEASEGRDSKTFEESSAKDPFSDHGSENIQQLNNAAEAFASGFGLVEKIDFDELSFE